VACAVGFTYRLRSGQTAAMFLESLNTEKLGSYRLRHFDAGPEQQLTRVGA